MAEKEYIERDSIYGRVKTETNPYGKPTLDYKSGVKVLDMIKQEPAADVVEVRHGRWIPHEHMSRTPYARNYDCSECGISPIECENYCPNCGAKMDGGKDG